MDHARTVWVVADGTGRKLARGAVARRTCELWAVAACLLLLAGGYAVVAGRRLLQQAAHARALGEQNMRLQAELRDLEEMGPQLAASLRANEGLMRQLERKSGFVFVDLARPTGQPSTDTDTATTAYSRGQRLEAFLGDLLEYWHDAERRLANTPSVRPARTAWLSSSYGLRTDPITRVTVMHKGLDLAGYIGMLVFAPADGKVIWTGVRGGYGQVVVLDHGWGLQTHFAHLSKYLVERGDQVKRGEPIAEMGNTGRSTGPHLHYEVRQDGFPTDPRNFILD